MQYEVELVVDINGDKKRIYKNFDIDLNKDIVEKFVKKYDLGTVEDLLSNMVEDTLDVNKLSDEEDEDAYNRLYDEAVENYQKDRFADLEDYISTTYRQDFINTIFDEEYKQKVVDKVFESIEKLDIDEYDITR